MTRSLACFPVVAIAAGVVLLAGAAPARADAPPPCPTAMGVVDRDLGPTLIALPADAATPEACPMVLPGGEVALFYYGSWRSDWPGAEQALPALRRVYQNGPGTTEKFDTVAAPGYAWHETIRNEGFETINLAGARRPAMKVAHEREGFDGNSYHSIITQWKDMGTGMTIYQTYHHIAGAPVPGMTWNPTTIYGGR